MLFALTAMLSPRIFADTEVTGVTSALIVRDKDTYHYEITAVLPKIDASQLAGETLYLFELYPYHSASKINELSPVGQLKASEKMTFSLDYEEGSQRIFAKFLLARRMADGNFRILGGAHYVDNAELTAKNNYAYPTARSKKGLAVQLYSDAQELNISHTVINVPVNDYIAAGQSSATVDFIYGNTTYYISRDMLAYLDYRVKLFTDAGVNVYINLLLDAPSPEQSDSLDTMYKADISTSVSLYGFNVSERDTVMYLESFVHFLAERYTRPDGEYGFAGSYILGYQVNSNRSYNYMGPLPLDSYLNYYTVAFRIMDTALRSVYSDGRSYISLANNFNSSIIEPNSLYDSQLDYSAKDTLDLFAFKIASAGDIPWRLAISAYPSDRTLTDFRGDSSALKNDSTPFISMDNIETLCEYMGKEELLYNGEKRKITISSMGISADNDSSENLMQAALYAYSYFKAETSDDIEALIYYRHVDYPLESGRFGLWSSSSETEARAADKKPIYNVFKYIDTDRSEATVQFALAQLGASEWASLLPGFTFDKIQRHMIIEETQTDPDVISKQGEPSNLFDFSRGSHCGFEPTDNAAFVELREYTVDSPMLYAGLMSSNPSEFMGVGCDFDAPTEIKGSKYISVDISAVAPAEVSSVTVMLRLYSNASSENGGVVYEGVANAVKIGEMTRVGFDIKALTAATDTIDGIKIWIRPTDQSYHEGDYGLWLGSVDIYGGSGTGVLAVIGWAAVIMLIAAAVGFAGIVISRNVRVRMKRRNHKNPLKLEDSGYVDRPPVNPMPDPTRTATQIKRVGRPDQTGNVQRPQSGNVQRPQTGNAQRPQTGNAQRPQTGNAQRPQSGNVQRPQSGNAQRPQNGSVRRPPQQRQAPSEPPRNIRKPPSPPER